MWTQRVAGIAVGILLVGLPCAAVARHAGDDLPETVMITLRPKAGAEAELARVIANHWDIARRLNLVAAAPHVTLRAPDEAGKVCFIDVFTWRDEDIPDNAPPEIRQVWDDMTRLTESRNGKPGLSITRVTLVGR